MELSYLQALWAHLRKIDDQSHQTHVLRGNWQTWRRTEGNQHSYLFKLHIRPILWYWTKRHRRQNCTVQSIHQSKTVTDCLMVQTREVPRLRGRWKFPHIRGHYGHHWNQSCPPMRKPHPRLAQMASHVSKPTNMATVEDTLERFLQRAMRHQEYHQHWGF